MVNQRVIEILGDITNNGDRVVKLAEVTCVFRDYYGKELTRERVPIIAAPLAPGQTKPFRLAFDDIADTWNQAVPSLVDRADSVPVDRPKVAGRAFIRLSGAVLRPHPAAGKNGRRHSAHWPHQLRPHLGRTGQYAELVPEVLIDRADDYQKGPVLRVLSRPVLGEGLLTSEGELHRQRRKLVAPAFAHQRVSKYAETMTAHALAAQAGWRDGERLDMAQAMMRLTLGIVGETLFSVDLLDQAESLGRDITTVQNFAIRQMRLPDSAADRFCGAVRRPRSTD